MIKLRKQMQTYAKGVNRSNDVKRFSGFTILIVATAIAGIAGYAVTWLVYRTIGSASYSGFALFWSALFLIVGGLSGVQQEITRASSPVLSNSGPTKNIAARFAILLSVITALGIGLSSLLWGNPTFGAEYVGYLFPLILGSASYVVIAVISGSLYGLSAWYLLGSMIATDALLRLLLVTLTCLFFPQSNLIAWSVAVPFALTPLLLLTILKKSLLNKVTIDVGTKKLSWNSTRTVSAALLTALLVSGFPLVLGISSPETSKAFLGELIFTITLARAPMIVVVSSLQSFFIVRFRNQYRYINTLLIKIILVVLSITGLLAIPAGIWGPLVLGILTSHPSGMNGWFIVLLVISSGLIAVLTVTGAALLAQSQHSAYVWGWGVAAFFTLVFLMLGLDDVDRIGLAIILAPIIGILVHIFCLVSVRKQRVETLS